MQEISVFWFRRDLRLNDNAGLYQALRSGLPVLPIFIFDTTILNRLEDKTDRRVEFIHNYVAKLKQNLENIGSSLWVFHGMPIEAFKKLLTEFKVRNVFTNHDYEPYAHKRDREVEELLTEAGAIFHTYKDQVIFEKNEVIKDDGTPYVVFTPFSKVWKARLNDFYLKPYPTEKYFSNFIKSQPYSLPSLEQFGFKPTGTIFPSTNVSKELIKEYEQVRDFPALEGTSRLSIHYRFGTVSIREKAAKALRISEKYLNELIWREFYMYILWHFPHVVQGAFKKEYDAIKWRNNEAEFDRWCCGQTGYPIVDAGMRQLNATGYMHNRVRMITASFLTKHLLIDWRWGEAYFAAKLLDYELASNNGGWQWAAGCGVDPAPYFRIFNPAAQQEKFDKNYEYVKTWVPEYNTSSYPAPIVEHKAARERCLAAYAAALKK